MTATMTTVPMIVPTLWALATILIALYGSAYVWAMFKEGEITKSQRSIL